MSEGIETKKKPGFFTRLKEGLKRSTGTISAGITGIFTKKKLDAESLEALEELLIRADLGTALAAEITASVGRGRYDKEVSPSEVRAILAEEVANVLAPVEAPLVVSGEKPFVVLVVGVNGSGKTTTIGKLAARYRKDGLHVVMGAGDTFRAAAVEQLKVWGARTGTTVIAKAIGSDAAGVAFETIEVAEAQGADVALIDTAGRLQNKAGLMAELEKIVRVLRKKDARLPHAVLLVLDATTGQNALSQVEVFQKVANVTGLAMTKLDGTAKGGILVAIAKRFGLPVHFIGVGEGEDDLQPFEAQAFATALAGDGEEMP
jgi:fused signal recognition particle receptor